MTADERALFAQLEGISVDESEIVDLKALSYVELNDMLIELTEELKNQGQAIKAQTRDSRDIHSLRYAVQLELRNR